MIPNDPALLPPEYDYSYDDFMTSSPYEVVYLLHNNPFKYSQARLAMEKNAEAVGFRKFRTMLTSFESQMKIDRLAVSQTSCQTEFTGQPLLLNCSGWICDDSGIYRSTSFSQRDVACAHPIMPVERLICVESGEVKIRLAYRCGGIETTWRSTIVSRDTISSSRSIISLSSLGISVTSSTAKALVDYLNDIENLNYRVIPESKSVSRLGYIAEEGFSPYVDNLVFDGEVSLRSIYNSVTHHGYMTEWIRTALECRKMSVAAKIVLATSFSSPLLRIVDALPFFVHLWSVESGTGKTLAIMLASSVWGNPALGHYTQTFNATQVGLERIAAFLNDLPLCIDELQLSKDAGGNVYFDVYQLAQGTGRLRGKRSGGIEVTPTWSCCMLTNGESPITGGSSGSGAKNRVLDIKCSSQSAVIYDGPRIAEMLRQHYGHAGEIFISRLYQSDEVLEFVRATYRDYYSQLIQRNVTEKQAMAGAIILTADFLAGEWVFDTEEDALTPDEIEPFLASRETVSAGRRAYDWLCDWIATNAYHFQTENSSANGDIYGELTNGIAYIIRSVFDKAVRNAGFDPVATLDYLRTNQFLITRGDNRGYSRSKRFGQTTPQCICVRINNTDNYTHQHNLDQK